VHSGASGARNDDALFFMLGCNRYRFDKKRVRTRYAELVFLHQMGYAGHVVHLVRPRCEMATQYFHARAGPVRIR
jgi:hypothetical protein